MDRIRVALVNASAAVSDNEATRVKDVLQTQLDRDFTPAWNIAATLSYVPRGGDQPADQLGLIILDASDTGDPAYHDVTATGLPLGKVFAGTARDLGYQWSGVASHELLEMLVDPRCNLLVYSPQTYNSYAYAEEICDPCEAEAFGYQIADAVGPILVSDFVFPAWFDPLSPTEGTQFDLRQHMHAPFQLLPGCHMDVLDVCLGRWRTFWGEGQSARQGRLNRLEYREELRRKPRHLWLKSEMPKEPSRAREPRRELASALDELLLTVQYLEERLRRFRTS